MPHKGLGGIKKDINAKDTYILALKRLCISKVAHCVVAHSWGSGATLFLLGLSMHPRNSSTARKRKLLGAECCTVNLSRIELPIPAFQWLPPYCIDNVGDRHPVSPGKCTDI